MLRTQSISSIGVPPFQLRKKCELLCEEFNELFSPEVGCLKDFELEIRFKPDSRPIFVKPRTVPIAIQEELNGALEAGIRKGIWMPCEFNDYGNPVVPIRKRGKSGGIRVCGDYSVTINSQLETHRQLMPTPEDLIRKLDGNRFFSKIDLADAYNQIRLAPESQRKLALSSTKSVLLQTRLPFGLSSAPGYFQQIMENLTADIRGVVVYLDDMLVGGSTAEEHFENLSAFFKDS